MEPLRSSIVLAMSPNREPIIGMARVSRNHLDSMFGISAPVFVRRCLVAALLGLDARFCDRTVDACWG